MSTDTGTEAVLAELAELLAHCPPFDALSPADRAGAVAAARIEEYQPGDLILDAFATMPTSMNGRIVPLPMETCSRPATCRKSSAIPPSGM